MNLSDKDSKNCVHCQVKNCIYHTASNCCNASTIEVANHTACRKGETFCSTFSPAPTINNTSAQ